MCRIVRGESRTLRNFLAAMLMIPVDAVREGCSRTAKNVKSTPNRQINFPATAILDEVQVVDAAGPPGICDWY